MTSIQSSGTTFFSFWLHPVSIARLWLTNRQALIALLVPLQLLSRISHLGWLKRQGKARERERKDIYIQTDIHINNKMRRKKERHQKDKKMKERDTEETGQADRGGGKEGVMFSLKE